MERERERKRNNTRAFLSPFSPIPLPRFPSPSSFSAVVLWELFTQEEPWSHLSSVQVVGKVGFGGGRARLPIPPTVPAPIMALIEACWAEDP